jgi:hypothetical protein
MKLFKCQHCGQLLYFENTVCEKCSHRLGYLPEVATLSALESEGNEWRALADKKLYRFCANSQFDVCNWMIEVGAPDTYCTACRHNRTVPDTGIQSNVVAWRKIEAAKRRLFYTLMKLKLERYTGGDDRHERLAFDFLASPSHADGPKIMTGHQHGLITVALEEADDAEREKRRTMMGEPYRTLLGHLRHEVGHYFWDVLVRDGGQLEACRSIFGDESIDYGQALQAYYANGAPANWQENFVSAYATAHPWEDFAETWAHYLHIVDALEMARAFGMYVRPPIAKSPELAAEVDFDPYATRDASTLVETWIPLSNALNSLNRTMGQSDLYPFVLSQAVVKKLGAIHNLIHSGQMPAEAPMQGPAIATAQTMASAQTPHPAPAGLYDRLKQWRRRA